MLVLSRKKNETLMIGHDVRVTIVEIRGDKVRLGVIHPKEVPVHREEVYEAIYGVSATSSPPTPTPTTPPPPPATLSPPAPPPPPVVPPPPALPSTPVVKVRTPTAVAADVVTKHLDAIRQAINAATGDGVYVEITPGA